MKSLFRSSHLPIILLIAVAFCIGYFSLKNYGESWDEPDIYRYGEYSLNAYQYIFHPQDLPPFDTNLNYYGPAYFMIVALLTRGAADSVSAWHLTYFVTFLAGVYVLYLLSKRWLSEWAAFGVALLFLTQPLLWGHAFINPKDTPFMTFFMASIYFGFQMVDASPRTSRRAILILVAGILLGLTVSLRVLGPLAGVFVLIYAIIKYKRQTISFSIIYFFIAGITAYLTWPYLWKSPIANYMKSLKMMSQFPFDAKILFWGNLYPPDQLPRSYFPTLFALQLTEPLLALLIVGLVVMASSRKMEPILLFSGWFLFPAFMIILSNSVLYDNARQLYFLLPPIFFAAGFALDWIFKYIPQTKFKIALLVLAILPGIFSAVRLHPYEYAYYNSFIGGTDGAFHQLETDYWGTSFKEAMEYINSVAPSRARILILSGPDEVAKRYARSDLQVITEENDPTPQEKYDYVLTLTRKNQNESRCKKSDVVQVIGRGDAVFTFIKKLGDKGFCK
jgi:hypothetical protein